MTRNQDSDAGESAAARHPAAGEATVAPATSLDTVSIVTTMEEATTLEIQVNGEPRRCGAGLMLVEVLEGLGYRPRLVVVEFNGEILPRQHWGAQAVVESDVLEVVTIVGGGS